MCGGDFNAPARMGAMLSNSARIVGGFVGCGKFENRMVSGLSESERAELLRLLRKLARAMRG